MEGAALLVRNWGDEYVAYSELTGQTHLLSLLPATVLTLLQKQPSHSPDLGSRVAEALQLEVDDQVLAALEQTLSDLERLGLIEQQLV